MKLCAVALLKWNPGDAPPWLLGCATDLSEYSFFQRGSVKEFMVFTGKTVVQKAQPGARQTVKAQSHICHAVVRENQLAAFVLVDQEYPSRAAMSVALQTIDDFVASGNTSWSAATADCTIGQEMCENAVKKYQDPAEADKLTRVQRELDKTKAILHETIEGVLNRGEKLDDLVSKSDALSWTSKQFYKEAKKTNSCFGCTLT